MTDLPPADPIAAEARLLAEQVGWRYWPDSLVAVSLTFAGVGDHYDDGKATKLLAAAIESFAHRMKAAGRAEAREVLAELCGALQEKERWVPDCQRGEAAIRRWEAAWKQAFALLKALPAPPEGGE